MCVGGWVGGGERRWGVREGEGVGAQQSESRRGAPQGRHGWALQFGTAHNSTGCFASFMKLMKDRAGTPASSPFPSTTQKHTHLAPALAAR